MDALYKMLSLRLNEYFLLIEKKSHVNIQVTCIYNYYHFLTFYNHLRKLRGNNFFIQLHVLCVEFFMKSFTG